MYVDGLGGRLEHTSERQARLLPILNTGSRMWDTGRAGPGGLATATHNAATPAAPARQPPRAALEPPPALTPLRSVAAAAGSCAAPARRR